MVYRRHRWILLAAVLAFFAGCCDDLYHPPDDIYRALVRNELMTFIDSSGNHLQLLLMEKGYDEVPYSYHDCSSGEPMQYFPFVKFSYLPPAEGAMKYGQMNTTFLFSGIFFSGFVSPNIDTTIQGHTYEDCLHRTVTDSLGEKFAMILDKDHGLVMFRKRDEYRWERVLD